MLSVMTATRRTLGPGAMSITGDPNGRLSFTLVEGGVAVWGSTEARVPEAFSYWVNSGPAMELATPMKGATQIVGSLGSLPDIIITNEQGVQARCRIEDEQLAPPVALPQDYFENHAQGAVTGLRIDRQGGLGRDALAAIANIRPRDVTIAVSEDASLVIGAADDAEKFKLAGPGFATLEDGRNTPMVVPYVVALAMHDGATGGTVDLTIDAQWGRLHRADQGITVQWTR